MKDSSLMDHSELYFDQGLREAGEPGWPPGTDEKPQSVSVGGPFLGPGL